MNIKKKLLLITLITPVLGMGASISPDNLLITGYMGSGSLTNIQSLSKRYTLMIDLSKDKLFMNSGYWEAKSSENAKTIYQGKATSAFDPQTDSLTITLRDNEMKSLALLTLVKSNYCPDAFDTGFLFIKNDPVLADKWLTDISQSLKREILDSQSRKRLRELRYQLRGPATIGNIADSDNDFFNRHFGTTIDFVYLTTKISPGP